MSLITRRRLNAGCLHRLTIRRRARAAQVSELKRPHAPKPDSDDGRHGEKPGAQGQKPRHTQQTRHGLGAEAAKDSADGHSCSHRREELLCPSGWNEAPHRQPERQQPHRQDLARDEHQGAQHDRSVAVRHEDERHQCERQRDENSGQPASWFLARHPAHYGSGHDQQSGARKQRHGQGLDPHPLQEQCLRGVQEREGRRTHHQETQATPSEERLLRGLYANSLQHTSYQAHGPESSCPRRESEG